MLLGLASCPEVPALQTAVQAPCPDCVVFNHRAVGLTLPARKVFDHVPIPDIPDPDGAVAEAGEGQAAFEVGVQGLAGEPLAGQLAWVVQVRRQQVPDIHARQAVAAGEEHLAVGGQHAGGQEGARGLDGPMQVALGEGVLGLPAAQPPHLEAARAAGERVAREAVYGRGEDVVPMLQHVQPLHLVGQAQALGLAPWGAWAQPRFPEDLRVLECGPQEWVGFSVQGLLPSGGLGEVLLEVLPGAGGELCRVSSRILLFRLCLQVQQRGTRGSAPSGGNRISPPTLLAPDCRAGPPAAFPRAWLPLSGGLCCQLVLTSPCRDPRLKPKPSTER
ncbi:uncharacterized protein LOC117284979 [Fukomys damarensis]|uniref:uncharacterized protein LOC117284979 n=1 Tax=Fukomys damarensis TaxID=885580 RepID=UPI001455DB4B|nr:uncharacterized protein LOC117284979 [Fukomys damarensis]XP_033616567.1 uncharacterized protein LOC117284979 [Fukomys damarensis]